MGAHLYRTPDDWYYSAVTTNAFANAADPYGGKFDYGFRTMASTPYGWFLGTANDYYGLPIFRANKRTSPLVASPGRFDIEARKGGGALLSWLAAYRALSYKIYRAEILPIALRDDSSFEGFLGLSPEKVPDTYVVLISRSELQPVSTSQHDRADGQTVHVLRHRRRAEPGSVGHIQPADLSAFAARYHIRADTS